MEPKVSEYLRPFLRAPYPAHGQSADKGILPFGGEGEHFPGGFHQFLADELAVVVAGNRLVHVEHVVAGGHDHRQIVLLGVALDPGSRHPVYRTPEDSVEQIEGLIRFPGSLAALPGRASCP